MSTPSIPSEALRTFARVTVASGDLDPMYDLINGGRKEYGDDWAYKYALHFFMYYDAGQSAALANTQSELDFWNMQNYGYADFKRGTERRHFRGAKGQSAMVTLQHMGSPKKIWNKLWQPTYTELVKNIEDNFQGCQIGPYFAWKAMDILDRGLGLPVKLTLREAAKYMPDPPKECAKAVYPHLSLEDALETVGEYISDLNAPGAPGKKCGYAEAETILCMIKGYFLTKTHTIGDDVEEKHKQLVDHPYLLKLLPPIKDWNDYTKAVDAARVSA